MLLNRLDYWVKQGIMLSITLNIIIAFGLIKIAEFNGNKFSRTRRLIEQ